MSDARRTCRVLLAGDHFVGNDLLEERLRRAVSEMHWADADDGPDSPPELDIRKLMLPWPLTPFGPVAEVAEASDVEDELIEHITDAEIIVTQMAPLTARVLAAAPRAHARAGPDACDRGSQSRRGGGSYQGRGVARRERITAEPGRAGGCSRHLPRPAAQHRQRRAPHALSRRRGSSSTRSASGALEHRFLRTASRHHWRGWLRQPSKLDNVLAGWSTGA
jgi:hypothetical protein